MSERKRRTTTQWILCILVLVLLAAAGLATQCPGGPTPTPIPPPTSTTLPSATPTQRPSPPPAPVIEPAGPEITVEPGKTVSVRASAEGAIRYEWGLQGRGQISSPTGPAILYTAPEEGNIIAILTVTAYNDQGASPQTSLIINVPPPIATAAVRLDALAIPAGWMSGGSSPERFINLGASPADCHTGTDCQKITYQTGGDWGGVLWWPLGCGAAGAPDAWNKVRAGTCGINVLEAGTLSAVNRLTFWARGDQGGEVVEFKIGAVDISPKPGRSLGKVTLTPTWKQYEIDLKGMDLTNAIALFGWVAADIDNPQGAVFYLDDIQFEGER